MPVTWTVMLCSPSANSGKAAVPMVVPFMWLKDSGFVNDREWLSVPYILYDIASTVAKSQSAVALRVSHLELYVLC